MKGYAQITASVPKELAEDFAALKAKIDEGIAAADRGDVVEWDLEKFIAEAREQSKANFPSS